MVQFTMAQRDCEAFLENG